MKGEKNRKDLNLFDKSLTIDEDIEIAETYKKTENMNNTVIIKDNYEQIVGFSLGNEFFGIDILNVEEIIKPIEPTYVPNTKKYLIGIINLRGKIIPIVDLHLKFELDKGYIGPESRVIIVATKKCNVGFLIDKVDRVYYIDKKSIEPTPANVPQNLEKYIKGVGKLDSGIITLLNVNEILKDNVALS